MKVRLTNPTRNMKLGPMPVTTTEEASCPVSCPLKKHGCYADTGPINWLWRKVPDTGLDWDELCYEVKLFPNGELWRHNQAGDLPGDGHRIDTDKLDSLVKANKGKRGFTYTHYTDEANLPAIQKANAGGFTVSLSANSLEEVDQLCGKGVPVVTTLPEDQRQDFRTAGGNLVIVCPHSSGKVRNCYSCGICQDRDREYVIGFPVHGANKKLAMKIYEGESHV